MFVLPVPSGFLKVSTPDLVCCLIMTVDGMSVLSVKVTVFELSNNDCPTSVGISRWEGQLGATELILF